MPRQPRLDAPGTLHHVRVRGIERTALLRADRDRADFVARLAALAEHGALTVYAWALLPTHAHLLVRTGPRPLLRSMRSLLTGYVGAFNRRHKRVGHLCQNRYKSIVVEEEPYLLELVRIRRPASPGAGDGRSPPPRPDPPGRPRDPRLSPGRDGAVGAHRRGADPSRPVGPGPGSPPAEYPRPVSPPGVFDVGLDIRHVMYNAAVYIGGALW